MSGSDAAAPAPVRVVIIDDQTLIREGIRSLLDVAGIDVAGEAADGRTGLDKIAEHDPDVVLLDLRMPRYDGLWTLRALRERAVPVPVLVLTTFDDDELVLSAVRSGAQGYLLKDVTLDHLTKAVRTLAAGGTMIAPSISDRLMRAIDQPEAATGTDDLPPAPDLTHREVAVLRLVAQGYPNREIASALHLAPGTVKNHVSSVLAKLGARDRTSAVLRALRDGLLD